MNPSESDSSSSRSQSKHRPKQERMIVRGLLALMGGLIAVDALLISTLM